VANFRFEKIEIEKAQELKIAQKSPYSPLVLFGNYGAQR